MLLKLAELRPDVKVNSVHISLNFSPDDQLTDEKMKSIAIVYMDKIGFGNQPYLIYRHHDAGHDHLHIVTTNIEMDGNRISLHNIGKLKSEPARKAIEEKYNLVKAEDQKQAQFELQPIDVSQVKYGEKELRRSIANVLGKVVNGYAYTSLSELNAVLRLYNVEATRGSEDSRTFKKKGLLLRVIDKDGNPIGVPLKASLFHNKPTLVNLEKKYPIHEVKRMKHKQKLKNRIDFALKNKAVSIEKFVETMKSEGVHVVVRENNEGIIYGLTYVDVRNRCVFNGSQLGKGYSAAGVLKRCEGFSQGQPTREQLSDKPVDWNNDHHDEVTRADENLMSITDGFISLFELISRHEYSNQAVPYELRKKKKRRRRRGISR
uniref:Relaxase n=1 Tax=Parastrongyloides trichosuri TaxID=131310 RepID=A0A0N4ZLH8_PARTI